MIRDRSILARFNPDGSLTDQYLQRHEALMAEGEWEWQSKRELAYVFESHSEAEKFAEEHRYKCAQGHERTPCALVLGSDAPPETPRHHAQDARAAEAKQRTRFGAVAPEEAFKVLERRHLA